MINRIKNIITGGATNNNILVLSLVSVNLATFKSWEVVNLLTLSSNLLISMVKLFIYQYQVLFLRHHSYFLLFNKKSLETFMFTLRPLTLRREVPPLSFHNHLRLQHLLQTTHLLIGLPVIPGEYPVHLLH